MLEQGLPVVHGPRMEHLKDVTFATLRASWIQAWWQCYFLILFLDRRYSFTEPILPGRLISASYYAKVQLTSEQNIVPSDDYEICRRVCVFQVLEVSMLLAYLQP